MTRVIAGAWYGIEGIPARWKERVENREYIERLARDFYEMKKVS